jgi:hypothetical protein
MNFKENITLIKGFKLENGHVWCKDYDFGHIDEIEGKTFTLDCDEKDLKLCKKGFHACDCLGKIDPFYKIDNDDNRFFNIFVEKAFFEDAEKFVFKSFTVKKQIEHRNNGYKNTGKKNIVDSNTDDSNIVDQNILDLNTGNRNTGNRNTGNRNNGDRNTDDRNTGDENTGYKNTGKKNTGDNNTGEGNTGDNNTGDWNTGNWNIGYNNTGNYNIGVYNIGDRNLTNFSSGFFATEEPKTYCFGKPTEYTYSEFKEKFEDIINEEPNFDTLMLLPNADKDIVEQYLEKYEYLKSK